MEATQLGVRTAGKAVRGAIHPSGLFGDLAADLLGLDDDIERIEQWTRDVETQFGEVGHHMDEHSAIAVDRLADRSAEIQDDLSTMRDSFTEMIA